MKKRRMVMTDTILLVSIVTMPLWANNVAVENVSLTEQNTTGHYTQIKFNISWENSWRTSSAPNNWDAVWVFAKYRIGSGKWNHCTLDTVNANHTAPSGSTIDAPNETKNGNALAPGIFIYRSADGSGSNNWSGVKLRWNYGTDGVADDAIVDVKVFAIEMVYIPQGSFSLYNGESSNLTANFNSGNTISSEDAIAENTITWERSESNWCGSGTSDGSSGYNAALGVNYPKGYKAIYCMKYEISQGQYADFLNMLTDAQDDNRFPNANGRYRHTISGSYGSYSASRPNRACNYLNWADGLAYADWAGLRPMTELEFEKICRGSKSAGTEYAWGNTTITSAATISGTEDGTETIINDDANCCYFQDLEGEGLAGGDAGFGPLRCGIFATGSSTREKSGASYYGVMEMSGNLWECCITVAKYCYNNSTWNNETGASSFDGQHGDGVLDASGYANVSNWPSPTAESGWTAYGSSIRGGAWDSTVAELRVSVRQLAAYPYAYRNYTNGFRCGRSAP